MKKIAVLLAEGCEETEAVTLIDLLRRAEFDVAVLSLEPGPVVASRGVVLLADAVLAEHLEEVYDAVVLPGGAGGAERLRDDVRVIDLLKRHAERGALIAAICAAPKVLLRAGLLVGRRVTSFPGHVDPADASYQYVEDPVVVDGNIATSRGPGTAMDFALRLIQELAGYSKRRQVEDKLQRPST